MSHTRRIYNNSRLKKAQRFNLDDGKMHLFVGIPLTKRSWICMGRCRLCRDPNREPRLIRKRLKEQFRFELRNESQNHELVDIVEINEEVLKNVGISQEGKSCQDRGKKNRR